MGIFLDIKTILYGCFYFNTLDSSFVNLKLTFFFYPFVVISSDHMLNTDSKKYSMSFEYQQS